MSRLRTSLGAGVSAAVPGLPPIETPWGNGATGSGNSPQQRAAGASRRGARRWCVLAVATSGGAGYAPIAPGTVGSVVGVALYVLLAPRGPFVLGAAIVGLTVAGIWAAGEAERIFERRDDGRIVIDEVAGQALALLPLAIFPVPERGVAALPLLAGFAAFRLFDIAKPPPVRWAERLPGGLGVMADDVVAGALAAGVVSVLGAFGGLGA